MFAKLSWGTIISKGGSRIITINASKLAACAGMHKYSLQSDLVKETSLYFAPKSDDDSDQIDATPLPTVDLVGALEADLGRIVHNDEDRRKLYSACTSTYSDATSVNTALHGLKEYAMALPDSNRDSIASVVRNRALDGLFHPVEPEQNKITEEINIPEEALDYVASSTDDLVREEQAAIDEILSGCRTDDERRMVRDVFASVARQGAVRLDDFDTHWSSASKRTTTRAETTRRKNIILRIHRICDRMDAIVETTCRKQAAIPDKTIDLARQVMYTRHGTEQEDSVRAQINETRSQKIFDSNSKFRKRELMTLSHDPSTYVYIGGRHDGMDVDGNIVEIKTRQRRFLGVPLYERIQIMAYMHIFREDDISTPCIATLAESLNGEVREHSVEWDDDLWAQVKSSVDSFITGSVYQYILPG